LLVCSVALAAADTPAFIALQFAQRVKLGEIDADELRKIRERAVDEMAAYDMAPVKAFFRKGP
jgi:hypothetical protein